MRNCILSDAGLRQYKKFVSNTEKFCVDEEKRPLCSLENLSSFNRRTRKSCGNTHLWLVFPEHFSFSQTSTRLSITRWKHGTCFLFLRYRVPFLLLDTPLRAHYCALVASATLTACSLLTQLLQEW